MAGRTQPVATPSRHRPTLVPLGHHAGKPPIPLHRPVTLIGSRSNARIHLTSSSVSKAHALLVKDGSQIYIRDLASRTHVLINDVEVHEETLADGDLIKIGSFTFKYTAGRSTSPPSAGVQSASLQVIGADYPVPIDQRVLLIGRRSSSDIHLLEESVSTAHAVIFEMDGKHHVRDLGSRTGTYVNGVQVHQHSLNAGDSIRIGETTLTYAPGESTLIESEGVTSDESVDFAESETTSTATSTAAEPAFDDLHIEDDLAARPVEDDSIDILPPTPPPSEVPSISARPDHPTAPVSLETPLELTEPASAASITDEDAVDELLNVLTTRPADAEIDSSLEVMDPTEPVEIEPIETIEERLPRRGWRTTSSPEQAADETASDGSEIESTTDAGEGSTTVELPTETSEESSPTTPKSRRKSGRTEKAGVTKKAGGGRSPVKLATRRPRISADPDLPEDAPAADQPANEAPIAEYPSDALIEVPPLEMPVEGPAEGSVEGPKPDLETAEPEPAIEKVAASRTRRSLKNPLPEAGKAGRKSRGGKAKSRTAPDRSAESADSPEAIDPESIDAADTTGMVIASREDDDIDQIVNPAMSLPPPASATNKEQDVARESDVIESTEPTPESALNLELPPDADAESGGNVSPNVAGIGNTTSSIETADALSDTGLSRAVQDLTGDAGQLVEDAADEHPTPANASSQPEPPVSPPLQRAQGLSGFRIGANSENFLGGTPVVLPPLAPAPFGQVGITIDESSRSDEPVVTSSDNNFDNARDDEPINEAALVPADESVPAAIDENVADELADAEATAASQASDKTDDFDTDALIDEILGTDDAPAADQESAGVTSDESILDALDLADPDEPTSIEPPQPAGEEQLDDDVANTASLDLSALDEPISPVQEPPSTEAAADQLAEWLSKASLYADEKKRQVTETSETIDVDPTARVDASDEESPSHPELPAKFASDKAAPDEAAPDRAAPPEPKSAAPKPTSAVKPSTPTIIAIPPPPAARRGRRGRKAEAVPSEPASNSSLRDDERIPAFQPGVDPAASAPSGFAGLTGAAGMTDVFAQMSPPATVDDAEVPIHLNGDAHDDAFAGNLPPDPFGGAISAPMASGSAISAPSPSALTPMDLVRPEDATARVNGKNGHNGKAAGRSIARVAPPRDLFFEGTSPADADFGPRHRVTGSTNGDTNGNMNGGTATLAAPAGTKTKPLAVRRPPLVAFNEEQARQAHVERKKRLRRIPILLGIMLALMVIAAVIIWYLLPPVNVAEAAISYKNFQNGHLIYDQIELQKKQTALLADNKTRNAAINALHDIDPEVQPGFLNDQAAYAKVANRGDAWSESPRGVLSIRRDSNDQAGDMARVRAMATALISANNDSLTRVAKEAKRKFEDLSAAVAKGQQEVSQLTEKAQQLRTMAESAPQASQISALKSQKDALDRAWGEAVAAVKTCQVELQQLRNVSPGENAPVEVPANVALTAQSSTPVENADIQKLEKQRNDVAEQLSAAMATRNDQSVAARKALDASFDEFQKQISDAKQLMKDSPELAAYVAAAQRLQETARQLSDDLVKKQEQFFAQINELKTKLTEQMEQRRVDQMHADPKIVELNERLEVARRQYNAAKSAGMKKEAEDKDAEIKLLQSMVKAQQDLVPNDELAAQTINQLQRIINAMEKDIADSRTRNDQMFEQMQKDFITSAHVQQMPDAQKAVASDLEKKLAEVNSARQQYSKVATESGVDDDTTKGLRTQVASLQAQLDEKKKQFAEQGAKNLSLAAEKARLEAIGLKERQLADLTKAQVDAQQAFTNKEKDVRDAEALADNARASGDQLRDVQLTLETAKSQLYSDTLNLKPASEAADHAVLPDELKDRDVRWLSGYDQRPLYIGATAIALLMIFVALIMHALHTAADELSLHSLSAGPEQLAVATEPVTEEDVDEILPPEEAQLQIEAEADEQNNQSGISPAVV